jgi:hypothetical protein
MGLQRDCTRILGLEGYRVEPIAWGAEGARSRVRISIERRGIRGYECSGSTPDVARAGYQGADLG